MFFSRIYPHPSQQKSLEVPRWCPERSQMPLEISEGWEQCQTTCTTPSMRVRLFFWVAQWETFYWSGQVQEGYSSRWWHLCRVPESERSYLKTFSTNHQVHVPSLLAGLFAIHANRFTYLGSIETKTGRTDEDVKARVNKACQAFATLRPVCRIKNLSCHIKPRLFNSNLKSVLLYRAETWRYTTKLDHKLQVFINTHLHQILRIRWP